MNFFKNCGYTDTRMSILSSCLYQLPTLRQDTPDARARRGYNSSRNDHRAYPSRYFSRFQSGHVGSPVKVGSSQSSRPCIITGLRLFSGLFLILFCFSTPPSPGLVNARREFRHTYKRSSTPAPAPLIHGRNFARLASPRPRISALLD